MNKYYYRLLGINGKIADVHISRYALPLYVYWDDLPKETQKAIEDFVYE